MNKGEKDSKSLKTALLQERLDALTTQSPKPSPHTLAEALQDLQIHQIELELQNLELRDAQYELQQAHDRYVDLYDFAPVGYATLDRNGTILDINLTGADLLGDTRTSFINRPLAPLLVNGQSSVFLPYLRNVVSSPQKQTLEVTIKNRKGRLLYARLESVSQEKDEIHPHSIQTAIIDITDRRHAEQELAESRARYRSLFEDSPLPQCEVDLSQVKSYFERLKARSIADFTTHFRNNHETLRECLLLIRMLDANKAACELFQARDKTELADNFDTLFTGATCLTPAEVLAKLSAGEHQWDTETECQSLSGKPLIVSLRLAATPGHETSLTRVQMALTDITAPKQADAEIQAAHRELEARVRSRTAELARANEALRTEISERRQAEEALAASEEKYRLLFNNESDAILLFDVSTTQMLEVNDAAIKLYGYSREEFLKLKATDVSAETDSSLRVIDKTATENKPRRVASRWHKNKQGETFPVEIGVNPFVWRGKKVMCAIVRDISERYAAEQQLRQAGKVFDNANEAIVVTDTKRNIVAVNNAFTQITGFEEGDVIGKRAQLIEDEEKSGRFEQSVNRALTGVGKWQGEIISRRKNGERFPAWKSISVVKDSHGHITNYVSFLSDISAIKKTEQKLNYLAHHDPLTELPNRLFFQSSLEKSLERAKRHKNRIALLFLDLDRFKIINDTLGHLVGDRLLKIIAERLLKCVRAEDTVARLGGDEFTVILDEITHAEDAALLAEKILAAVTHPVTLDNQQVATSTSIGIGIFPDDADNANTLIRAADTAMYRAKEKGKHTYEFYTAELTDRAFEHLSVEHGIREGLKRDEFVLNYQPQVDLASGRLTGVESLLRWNHPQKGLIMPDNFIPVAEDSGLISLIDTWAVEAAFAQAAAWRASGLSPFKISINISAYNISRTRISEKVKQALHDYNLTPEWIGLEVTENVFQTGRACIEELRALKEMGITLAIDDFGTGYSSLSSLKKLPIDYLKIDRMFIKDLPDNPDDLAITRTIIAMAHSLNLKVIAEGVENERQRQFLEREKCTAIQGKYINQALPPKSLIKFIKQHLAYTMATPI